MYYVNKELQEQPVKELRGMALNWAVALSQKYTPFFGELTSIEIKKIKDEVLPPIVSIKNDHEVVIVSGDKKIGSRFYSPATKEDDLLKKLEHKYRLSIQKKDDGYKVSCRNVRTGKVSEDKQDCYAENESLSVAVCRSIVLFELGVNVMIPKELTPTSKQVTYDQLSNVERDWVVSKIEGISAADFYSFVSKRVNYSPSTDWKEAGDLMDKYDIDIQKLENKGYLASCSGSADAEYAFGKTRQIAICNAIILHKKGISLNIPLDLNESMIQE